MTGKAYGNGINWSRRRYNEEDFVTAWNESKSKSEVLRRLGIPVAGGNINTITKTAKILGFSESHFDRSWLFRKENPNRINNHQIRKEIPLSKR